MRKPTFWFPTWSVTNQAVQLQKMARGLKFQIKKLEGLFYLCSENKGADQLLCFRICKMLVFSRRGSLIAYASVICNHGPTSGTERGKAGKMCCGFTFE